MFSELFGGSNGFVHDGEGMYMEFVCDTVGDINDLPTGVGGEGQTRPRPGSMAIVANPAQLWMLNCSRQWVFMGAIT